MTAPRESDEPNPVTSEDEERDKDGREQNSICSVDLPADLVGQAVEVIVDGATTVVTSVISSLGDLG